MGALTLISLESRQKKLSILIVDVLAEHGTLSAESIRQNVRNQNHEYALSSVYKELKGLIHSGIVVKFDTQYTLSMNWVVGLIEFSQKVKTRFIEQDFPRYILPKPGERKRWKFTSLFTLNDFWNQINITLAKQCQDEILYEYNPHQWYDWISLVRENQTLRAFQKTKKDIYVVVGQDSWLNRWPEESGAVAGGMYSYGGEKFGTRTDCHLGVMDDYIVTIRLSHSVAKYIDELAATVTSTSTLEDSQIDALVQMKVRATISLESNEVKATKLKQKFLNHWEERFAHKPIS
ncbi:MAG: hypothetical protein KDD70_05025 [Bdellovibrionales bacterium]|nr:hypothetical protein [Bdellovibrionales bacterium]